MYENKMLKIKEILAQNTALLLLISNQKKPTNENGWKEEINGNVEYWSCNVHQPIWSHRKQT